jgi:dephospho-CoA kinase
MKKTPHMWAVIGGKGSGKDTAADYLAEKLNGSRLSTSVWLREYVDRSANPAQRRHEAEADLRKERGPGFFIDEALKLPPPVIISGLRTLEALARVRNEGGVIVHIEADRQTRHQRVIQRARPGEIIAPVWVDNYVSKRVEQGGPTRDQLTAQAEHVIDNNGTLEELHARLDELVKKLQQ